MRKKAPKDSTTIWTIHPNNFYLFYWIQQVKYYILNRVEWQELYMFRRQFESAFEDSIK